MCLRIPFYNFLRYERLHLVKKIKIVVSYAVQPILLRLRRFQLDRDAPTCHLSTSRMKTTTTV